MGVFKDLLQGGVIGSLINGAFSLGSTAMGDAAARAQLEREQAFNAKQAEINRQYQTGEREATQAYNTSEREAAQQFNLDMWNMQNAYNDPAAQMQRMIAAGINPAAAAQGISGNGSSAGPVAASRGASSTPGSGSAATTPSIAGFVGENIANSVNSLWQNMAIQKEIEGRNLDNAYKAKELNTYDERFQLQKAEINATVEELNKIAKDKDADIQLKQQNFEFLEKYNEEQLNTARVIYQRTSKEIEQIDQQIANLKKQYDLTDEEINNIKADTAMKEANTENIQADTDLKGAEVDLLKSEENLNNAHAALLQVQKLIADKDNIIKDVEVGAAEIGISFGAPEFYTLYKFQQITGQDPMETLMKNYFRVERRNAWRGTATRIVENTADAATKVGGAVVTKGRYLVGGWNPNPDPYDPERYFKRNRNRNKK